MGLCQSGRLRACSGGFPSHRQGTSRFFYLRAGVAWRCLALLGVPSLRAHVRLVSYSESNSRVDGLKKRPVYFLQSSHPAHAYTEKRLFGEAVDDPTDWKAGHSRASRARRRSKKQAAEQAQEHPRTRQDMVLSWEARRGSSTALIGLGRAGEALTDAEEAMELANQVGDRMGCPAPENICIFRVHGAHAYVWKPGPKVFTNIFRWA